MAARRIPGRIAQLACAGRTKPPPMTNGSAEQVEEAVQLADDPNTVWVSNEDAKKASQLGDGVQSLFLYQRQQLERRADRAFFTALSLADKARRHIQMTGKYRLTHAFALAKPTDFIVSHLAQRARSHCLGERRIVIGKHLIGQFLEPLQLVLSNIISGALGKTVHKKGRLPGLKQHDRAESLDA